MGAAPSNAYSAAVATIAGVAPGAGVTVWSPLRLPPLHSDDGLHLRRCHGSAVVSSFKPTI
jgi:hypothetical protein